MHLPPSAAMACAPEMLTLLREREAMRAHAAEVTDIASRREGGFVQAGPNPACPASAPLPGDVLRFPPKLAFPSNDAFTARAAQ